MKEISAFFDKFNNRAIKELKKREVICNAISKITKQPIEIKDLQINNGTLTIKGSQSLKSEIFLKKTLILKTVLKETNMSFVDIK